MTTRLTSPGNWKILWSLVLVIMDASISGIAEYPCIGGDPKSTFIKVILVRFSQQLKQVPFPEILMADTMTRSKYFCSRVPKRVNSASCSNAVKTKYWRVGNKPSAKQQLREKLQSGEHSIWQKTTIQRVHHTSSKNVAKQLLELQLCPVSSVREIHPNSEASYHRSEESCRWSDCNYRWKHAHPFDVTTSLLIGRQLYEPAPVHNYNYHIYKAKRLSSPLRHRTKRPPPL